jgi:hypothetical protein
MFEFTFLRQQVSTAEKLSSFPPQSSENGRISPYFCNGTGPEKMLIHRGGARIDPNFSTASLRRPFPTIAGGEVEWQGPAFSKL